MSRVQKTILWTAAGVVLALAVIIGVGYTFLLKNLWNFLVVDEEPRPADVIIVLSSGQDRVLQGVKLYQEGYARKLLFTGGGSLRMKQQALSLGVPEEDILVENESGTTFLNAKYSYEIVRAAGFRSAIVVTSPYHTRRASVLFHEVYRDITISISAVPFEPSVPGNWWKDRDLAEAVVLEYLKFIWHYLFER